METVDFGKCVYDTVFSFYDEFQTKGLEPEIDFCEENILIEGNTEAIRRILQNIIKNALVHGSQKIRMKLFSEKNDIIFLCENDLENPWDIDIKKIFSKFYKADTARTSNTTGLGLSIAKSLVERMDGTIIAEIENDMFLIRVMFFRKKL